MKKTELTQDEFAKFIANKLLSIKHYNFDLLYDVKKIVTLLNEHRGNAGEPVFDIFHLMLRSTGSDLVRPDDEDYSVYDDISSEVYSLKFCWNCDYMRNTRFCEVDQLR